MVVAKDNGSTRVRNAVKKLREKVNHKHNIHHVTHTRTQPHAHIQAHAHTRTQARVRKRTHISTQAHKAKYAQRRDERNTFQEDPNDEVMTVFGCDVQRRRAEH